MALALDLVHHDPAGGVEPTGRRSGFRELTRERHRDAGAVRRGEELLGARLPFGLPDARREREPELVESPGVARERADASRRVPFPDDLCGALDVRHQYWAFVPSG